MAIYLKNKKNKEQLEEIVLTYNASLDQVVATYYRDEDDLASKYLSQQELFDILALNLFTVEE